MRNLQINLRHQEVHTLKSRPAHDFHLQKKNRGLFANPPLSRPIPSESKKACPKRKCRYFSPSIFWTFSRNLHGNC